MTDVREAAGTAANCWRVLYPALTPALRVRSDVQRVDAAMTELRRALQPPLDDATRRDRDEVIAERLAELGAPQWQARKPRLGGEADD